MSYCPTTNSAHHASSCYKITLSCPKIEHEHSTSVPGPCYDKEGNLKCGTPPHTHSGGSPCHSPVGPLCGGD